MELCEECGKKEIHAKGKCYNCYQSDYMREYYKRKGRKNRTRKNKKAAGEICETDGCENEVEANGLCDRCRSAQRRAEAKREEGFLMPPTVHAPPTSGVQMRVAQEITIKLSKEVAVYVSDKDIRIRVPWIGEIVLK